MAGKRKKGEGTVRLRKDGRWEGRYIKTHLPSGKTVYGYLYARTYRDLKEKMLCQERLKNKPHLSSSPTFQTVAEEWITSRQPHLKEASIVTDVSVTPNCSTIIDFTFSNISSELIL